MTVCTSNITVMWSKYCGLVVVAALAACSPTDSVTGPPAGESPAAAPADAENAPRANSRKVILFLGDSLTAGYGLDPEQAFPALVQEKIDARGWSYEVVNAGVSGDTTSGGLARTDWLLKRPVEVLFLELGGNDGLRGIPPEVTRKNLHGIVNKTREKNPQAALVVAGMLVPPNMGPEYFNQFRDIFPEIASQHQGVLIPFLLEGVAARPELNLPDGIHPTAEGHKLVADHVWSYLEPLLQQRAETTP